MAAWRAIGKALLVLTIVAAVALVYREAVFAYLLEDDFHWFADARRFAWQDLFRLERYGHFYRPVIEMYVSAIKLP